MQIARVTFAAVSWLFIALVALQVFFAGLGLFGATDMALHRDFGYLVPLVALLVLIAALAARAGARTSWLAGGLLAITFIQTSLPYFRDGLPFVAALHPVNALLIFWLGLVIARRATALYRAPVDAEPGATEAPAPDIARA
jgi:Family of unknown function (DUF6220)